ncbi:3390_t:CDS:1, partial [Ambispora leptoticha]
SFDPVASGSHPNFVSALKYIELFDDKNRIWQARARVASESGKREWQARVASESGKRVQQE